MLLTKQRGVLLTEPLPVLRIGQQAVQLLLDYGIAFARAGLQSGPLEHRNVAAAVADKTGRPRFVKRSLDDGDKVKIAAIDPDFA